MTDKELIERLRPSRWLGETTGKPAADRIEAITARVTELEWALRVAIDFLRTAPLESGYCCCGDAVEAHGMWSGHSPVDELAYHASGIEAQLRAALAGDKP